MTAGLFKKIFKIKLFAHQERVPRCPSKYQPFGRLVGCDNTTYISSTSWRGACGVIMRCHIAKCKLWTCLWFADTFTANNWGRGCEDLATSTSFSKSDSGFIQPQTPVLPPWMWNYWSSSEREARDQRSSGGEGVKGQNISISDAEN